MLVPAQYEREIGLAGQQCAVRFESLVCESVDDVSTSRLQLADDDVRGAVGIGASRPAAVVSGEGDAEHTDLHPADSGCIPAGDTREWLSRWAKETIRGRPRERRSRNARDQRVAIDLELMVAESGEVQLRRVELLPHLLAAVPLARKARRQEIARQDELHRAASRERIAEVGNAREPAGSIAKCIPEVDVVDEEKSQRGCCRRRGRGNGCTRCESDKTYREGKLLHDNG